MDKILAIGAAGALGAVARYSLGGAVHRFAGIGFPWGTLAVNMLGCFAIGVLWTLAHERGVFSPELRTVILVGFLASFTTFSTFAAETGQLLAVRDWLLGIGNAVVHVVLGVALFFLGQALVRAV